MERNFIFDDSLLEQEQKSCISKHKKEAVNASLKEYVEKNKKLEIAKVFETLAHSSKYKKSRY